MTRFDFIVVGGGSGGIAAARRAAQYGQRVALIEARRLGGTCVNVGCVPKKVMFNAANLAEAMHDAAGYGFKADTGKLDWAGLKAQRDAYVQRLNQIYAKNLDSSGVQLFRGRAKLVDAHTVEVDCTRLTSPHILIATGGYPRVPDLPGAQLGITSDGFFELATQPTRVAVVGTGYIGVELAGIFQALGTQVSLLSRYDEVLPHFEPMLSHELRQQMVEAGVDFQPNAEPVRVVRGDDGLLKLLTQDQREIGGFDCLLWATGRAPATPGLDLEAAGVETDARGFVHTDEFQNTSVRGIYAVGDVTGRVPLTPVAIAAGRRLADRLFDAQTSAKLNYEDVPTAVFSHPPIGTVGLTEPAAKERYGEENVKVYSSRFTNLYYSMTHRRPISAMKLITLLPENERVIGLHVIGLGADEMIQGFAAAIKAGATKATLDETVAVHPTAAEEFVTMR